MLALGAILAIPLLVAPGRADGQEDREIRAQIAAAPQLKVEEVGIPIRSSRGGIPILVPNRDGQSYDVLIDYYDTYWGPHTFVMLDLGTGAVRKHVIEKALLQRSYAVAPNGNLYSHMSSRRGTAIWVYDPDANQIRVLPRELPFNGETRPIVVGTDGLIYGAGSSQGRAAAYQLDPQTEQITEYGLLGPSHAPNDCWGYSVAADDTHVYVASGKIPWYLLAYEKKTGKTEVLLTTGTDRVHLSVGQERYGATASVKEEGQPAVSYWLLQGKLLPRKDAKESPPWSAPAVAKPWVHRPPPPELGTGELIPNSRGDAALWVRSAAAAAAAPKDPPADAKPETLGWNVLRYQVPTYAAPVSQVCTLPDGRIFGAAGNYLGNFVYDPASEQCTHLGKLSLSQYCQIVAGGKVYLSGYPSAALYEYDPSRPWTAFVAEKPWLKPLPEDQPASNPRRVAYLSHAGSGAHKMWAAALGADGKVYFGGRWYRNGEGGGLGWYDPKTQQAGGISEPFSNQQICFLTAADRGRTLVISTRPVRDAVLNKPMAKAGKLFVFDIAAGKIVREIEPVADALFAGAIAGGADARVLGLTYDPTDTAHGALHEKRSVLYSVDLASGKIVFVKKLPFPVGFLTNENFDHTDGFDFQTGPDGKVWTYTGGAMEAVNPEKSWGFVYTHPALVRIDPRNGSVDVLGKMDRAGAMAFRGTDLYLSGGSKYDPLEKSQYLRRIRGIVPTAP